MISHMALRGDREVEGSIPGGCIVTSLILITCFYERAGHADYSKFEVFLTSCDNSQCRRILAGAVPLCTSNAEPERWLLAQEDACKPARLSG